MAYYPNHVLAALLLMIVTGAARGVCVKLFYQLGFEKPIFVTILFLLGQALSLPIHHVIRCFTRGKNSEDTAAELQADEDGSEASLEMISLEKQPRDQPKRLRSKNMIGSATGLNARSHEAIQWIHRIPWWAKPAVPGICNLCEATFRFTGLVFLSASIAEIIMSGVELIFVVFAARLIRKRMISRERWIGVGIMMAGLLLVGGADFIKSGDGENTNKSSNQILGISLVVGKCFTSAIQDLFEEILVQEANMPPTLLMGLEGIFGLTLIVPLYFVIGRATDEHPSETVETFGDSAFKISYAVFLVLLFTATSTSQILSTGLTSSMTRNLWKNFRGLLAWIVGLVIFYASGNEDLGEAWLIPQSFVVLTGFCIMVGGLKYYYRDQHALNDSERSQSVRGVEAVIDEAAEPDINIKE